MCRISTESVVIRIDIGCVVESRATPQRKKFSSRARDRANAAPIGSATNAAAIAMDHARRTRTEKSGWTK
jgi:hypothetical protein